MSTTTKKKLKMEFGVFLGLANIVFWGNLLGRKIMAAEVGPAIESVGL